MNTLYLPELREMIATEDEASLREFIDALLPARAAEFMEGLGAVESWCVLRVADDDRRAEVFGFLDAEKQAEMIESLVASGDAAAMSGLVADLPADDRVDLLNDIDEAVVQQLLPLLPIDDRRETLRLRGFEEGTAGSVMTTEVVRLPEHLTVAEALTEISKAAQEVETVYNNYVVDDNDRLLGLLSARQLVTHYLNPDQPISELMQRDVVTVRADDDQEAVAEKVADYDFLAIPVVDDNRRLLGIITHDDIIDVFRAEATEDALLSAGVAPLEAGYLRSHWFTLACNRGIWLGVLFVAALLTAFALLRYEEGFDKVWWLVLFIPLVISSGGNSGSQSATLVIRGLTDGEVSLGDWRRVLRRELIMGLTLGSALAVVGFASAWLLTRYPPDTPPTPVAAATKSAPTLTEVAVVPVTLLLVVVCGTLCGGALPLLFQKLGLDPALMSNPFVAGIIDIAGIVIYMTVAVSMIAALGG
ncbi:Magnesium transporter MgtE [Planctomycetes bacterium MalM25]|nr:Magnesium transporter MgtE [Planctomycetes bacterium MalM25]